MVFGGPPGFEPMTPACRQAGLQCQCNAPPAMTSGPDPAKRDDLFDLPDAFCDRWWI